METDLLPQPAVRDLVARNQRVDRVPTDVEQARGGLHVDDLVGGGRSSAGSGHRALGRRLGHGRDDAVASIHVVLRLDAHRGLRRPWGAARRGTYGGCTETGWPSCAAGRLAKASSDVMAILAGTWVARPIGTSTERSDAGAGHARTTTPIRRCLSSAASQSRSGNFVHARDLIVYYNHCDLVR